MLYKEGGGGAAAGIFIYNVTIYLYIIHGVEFLDWDGMGWALAGGRIRFVLLHSRYLGRYYGYTQTCILYCTYIT